MNNQFVTQPVECYDLYRTLITSPSATTEDGWDVFYGGNPNTPHSQTITARKGEKEIVLKHYRGSEGIARVLSKARTT